MKKFVYFFAALFLIIFAISGISYYVLLSKINSYNQLSKPVFVKIHKGESIKDIAEKLEKSGVIKNKDLFILYARYKNKPLKYGFYMFKGKLNIPQVWEILYSGKEKLIKFTIIPGEDLIDIGQKLEKAGFVKKEDFYKYVFDAKNVRWYGLEGKSFEGYFPPDTYYFRKDFTLRNIVETFLRNFKKRYKPVLKPVEDLTPYQVMIVASMVEKETAIIEEKPIIAGIIINRLKKGMKLQIDPTIIYALKLKNQWYGDLTRKNMKTNSPYNTYLYKGLPPTPICSFSLESLKAVINYKKTDYLYFFSSDGKRHSFSKTYREHLRKVRAAY
ncbi:endolytic transglycosylase MltG [Persephonella sp. IF05-L8]|uniref:endolytic transglycosylase MltG n=1 Tax=Persephonella sp. IF05-L8 TaxID=1158338 RepID=UPI0004965439